MAKNKRTERYKIYANGSAKLVGFSENGKSYTYVEDKHHKTYRVKNGKKTLVSESIGDNTYTYDVGKKHSKLRFSNILHLIVVISLSVILFSWGSTGYLDSAYKSKSKLYYYNSYELNSNGEAVVINKSDVFYDYDWSFKFNQLSSLINVFTIPDFDTSNVYYRRIEGQNFINQMYEDGFLTNVNIDQTKYNTLINGTVAYSFTNPSANLIRHYGNLKAESDNTLQLIIDFFSGKKKQTNYYLCDFIDDRAKVNTWLRASSYFKHMSYSDFVEKYNLYKTYLLYTEKVDNKFTWRQNFLVENIKPNTTIKILQRAFSVFVYPFSIISSTVYDLGVFMSFLTIW